MLVFVKIGPTGSRVVSRGMTDGLTKRWTEGEADRNDEYKG